MAGLKLSTNASVVIVVVIGTICAAYLAISESPLASTVIPVIVTLVGGAVVQLLKQQQTDTKVDEIKVEASAATAQSKENGAQLSVIAPQVERAIADVAENTAVTNTTHQLVNGHAAATAAAAEESAQQRIELAQQKAEIAAMVELARTTLAELKARAEGVIEGREQVTSADTVVLEAPVLILPPVEP